MSQKPTTYVTVQRALEILTCFLHTDEKLSTQELSNLIGFHKSAMSRLLRVMEYYGFLRRDEVTKKYSLGKTIFDLGRVSSRSMTANLLDIAKPYIDGLRDKLDEDIPFDVISGDRIVLIYAAEGSQPLRIAFKVGDRVPPHVGAGAKAILAFSEEDVIARIIKPRARLKRYTPNTITKRSELMDQFKRIRAEGVAYDLGEFNPDITAVAAPVFNHEDKAVAAVNLGGPTQRISALFGTSAIDQLKETAAKISNELCFPNHR
ncbi:IclR family transcriptional regulator [Thermodesulfobacteriota bacterium]